MKNYLRIVLLNLALFAFCFESERASALVSTYSFSQTTGAYTAITGGTVVGDSATNEANFTALPIGFTFYFNGLSRTTFSINANGYVVFGTTGLSSHTVISTGLGGSTNVIAGLNYDIRGQLGSEIMYRTIGSAPNRTLVVQWKNFRTNNSTGENLNFQIRLNETSNIINVVYGSCTLVTSNTAQVGLKGGSNADFNNRSATNTVNTWATSTAGVLNTDSMQLQSGYKPASGLTYTWQPSVPAAPLTISFSPITPTSITVNWVDNSTDESAFEVYMSDDNVTFNLMTTVNSTTGAATGDPYNYPVTGLLSNTQYWFRVYSIGNVPSASLPGTANTLAGTMCGSYTVGPTGDYATIRAAVDDLILNGLSCAVIIQLQATYASNTDTFPLVIPYLGCTAANTLTLRPITGATNLVIAGNDAPMFDLSAAEYFTIDGRAGGTGSTRNLTIRDSSATGSAIRFVNDAQNNTLKYLNIRGGSRGATTTGVVHFGTGTSAGGGNSNNTVSNCDISKTDTAAQVLIYSNTGAGTNDNNTITANNLHDWYAASGSNYGMNIGAANETWTITNNNFYMTAAQTYSSSSTHAAINIAGGGGGGGSGSGFVVTGNSIGGSTTGAGGSAWVINGTGGPRFNGIAMNVDVASYSSVQGNIIKNISLTTNAASGGGGGGGGSTTIFNGITISGGNVNVGNVTPNTIGSTTSNNSITTIEAISGMQTVGINISSGDTVLVSGNSIGGINANDSAATVTTSLAGIIGSGGVLTITNNYIGSNTQANNMTNAVSTGAGNTTVSGILLSNNVSSATVTGNTIKNVSNQSGGTGTNIIRGISSTAGSNIINNNIVEALINTSPQTGANGSASVQGIYQTSGDAGQTISGNTIRNLRNTSTTGAVIVTGIYNNSATTGTNVIRKNRIYGLAAPSNTSIATINGIQLNGGSYTYENNMISIGTDTSNNSYTKAHNYNGILKTTNNANNFFYNSVNVSGTGVLNDTANTFAFRRTGAGADTIQNNIFANLRSNVTAGGKHYSIAFGADSNAVSGKNDLFGNGTGYKTGLLDTTDLTSLFNWFTATGVDSNSVAVNPYFTSNVNLHINNANQSGIESKGYTIASITTDYDGQVRPGPAGSVNGGATAPDLGADEFDGIPVSIDMGTYALSKPSVTGCHSATDSVVVTIKNYSSVTINFALNPTDVHAFATGPNPMTFPVVTVNSGTLTGGSTRNVVISTSYNMSTAGTYGFSAYATTTGDLQLANDSLPAVSITVAGGTVSPSAVTTCSGLPVTLAVSGNTSGGTIQWQSSPNNSTWTNIGGATNPTVIVTPGSNTYYRAVSCGVYNSNSANITVTSVNAPLTTGDTRCGSGPVTVSATSANQVMWFDSSSGGSLLDTGSTYTTNVTSSGSFYAAVNGNVSAPKTLSTIISGPNNSAGIMFTVTAITNVTITGFSAQADSGVNTWAIYYRKDNYNNVPGGNTSSAGWIFVDSVSGVTSAGAGAFTTIPITTSIFIPGTMTYSFYIRTLSGPNIIYSPGTGVGDVNTSNTELQIRDGHSGANFNANTFPRVFNGIINYKTSCLSNRVAAAFTVTLPTSINALTSQADICEGDSVNLTASSANSNYQYVWQAASGISDSTGNSIYVMPDEPTMFYLHGSDSISGCGADDSVFVNVYPKPDLTATANPDSVCLGDTVNLNADVPTTYIFSGGNQSNQATTYPAPYGNSMFGARHQILILAAEMAQQGMQPGYINSLVFSVTDPDVGQALTNFTIKIGSTNVNALTTTFQTTPMTTVYTNAGYLPVNGLNTHAFSSAFYWNGTSNVIIETCFNNTTDSVNARMRYMNTNFPSCTYHAANNAGNCSATSGDTVVNRRPYMRLGIRNQYLFQWFSTEPMSSTTIANPYSVPGVNTSYQITVTDTISGCISRDTLNVGVAPVPVVYLGRDTTVCGSILLDAGNPGNDYLWNNFTQNQTLLVDTTGTYSVRVSQFGSCSASDTINVVVLPMPFASLALAFDSVCVFDGIQPLTGGSPANGVYGGPGVTGTNFDPAAVTPGIVAITYSVTDSVNGCVNTVSNDVFVDVCNGVRTMTEDGMVSIYPNPSSGIFTIDLSAVKGRSRVVLMNMESQSIGRWEIEGNSSKTIDLDNLAEGVYFMRINNEEKNYVIRLVKQN